MAYTRQIFSEDSWAALLKEFPDVLLSHDLNEGTRVHCVIPLCIGFSDAATVSFDKLDAWVEGITNKGFSFTLYQDPKDNDALLAWEKAFATWKQAHPNSCLNKLSEDQLKHINKFRETSRWTNAFNAITKLSKDKNELFEQRMKQDIDHYCAKYPEANRDDSILHVKQAAADCFAWMSSKSEWAQNKKELSVLFYEHGLGQVMRLAITNAHHFDLAAESLLHLKKLKYDKVLIQQSQVTQQQVELLDEALAKLVQVMAYNQTPPDYSGPILLHACMEGIKLSNQSQSMSGKSSHAMINECLQKRATSPNHDKKVDEKKVHKSQELKTEKDKKILQKASSKDRLFSGTSTSGTDISSQQNAPTNNHSSQPSKEENIAPSTHRL